MDREQVLNVVIKHIKLNIDGLENVEIDPHKTIGEYGASSLDGVEIVSACMRELKIKIPRTEVSSFKTIDDLVELFAKFKDEASQEVKVTQ
ncbi:MULTISPECIES: phosphopantetheine-binding protein [unclassified Nostoc]|uniref:phosphopantetheine-binding protein n=1 Tax=unclassified Nostoc TaxID=2593658 RepID=UPI002AD2EDBB|nr:MULTISPECIES: phosphopantetheine-binding protein [unclassified Nostoc]MDZ8029567.1 phosphopantetheine-binding protein [Nostoc sp. DedSLP04]MDZ8133655.1 phosphopantetheine-binding protein [Nostoc sp. DedQUE07]MDZ8137764.1 phosphopantetheine-binding protein [Nostoc sp. DedQUE04]